MDIQTRKLNFIEQILGLSNERTLRELENVLQKESQEQYQKASFQDLAGVINEEEAQIMEKEIEDACEQIHEDDWK